MQTPHEPGPPAPITTRDRILRAASAELARAGFAGARMEAIAQLAGVKKQVIYYYFPSKVELARAVLDKWNADAADFWIRFPTSSLAEICHAAIDQALVGAEGISNLVWEGQEYANEHSSDFPIAPERAASLRRIIETISTEQSAGDIRADIDPEYLGLLLVLLTTTPGVLPQVSFLMVGREWNDPSFTREWHALVDQVLEGLRP